MTISFTVEGAAPRTKKTHGRIVGTKHTKTVFNCKSGRFEARSQARYLPSQQYQNWYAAVQFTTKVNAQMALRQLKGHRIPSLPIAAPIGVCAHFHLDNRTRGDLTGYQQALGDLLEGIGIIANDKLIDNWDGSRLFPKSDRPRIDVTLEWPL
jgi:Holliday junction resolvase RusA-like endonuclease